MTFARVPLTRLRDLQESSFLEPCTIQDEQEVSDGAGGTIVVWVTLATEMCRVSPMALARAEEILGDRFQDTIPYEIALRVDTAARSDHRIVVGADTHEVIAIWGAGTYSTTTKAICIKR